MYSTSLKTINDSMRRHPSEGKSTTSHKKIQEELHLCSMLLDNATDFIALHDMDGNFVYVNGMMCKSLGYTREELLSMNLNQLDDQVNVDLGKTRMAGMLEKGSVTFEAINKRKDGSLMQVEVHDCIIEEGERKLILGVVRDITGRKKTEEELKLDTYILNHTTDFILVHDLDGNMVYVNDTACQSLGYTRKELLNLKAYKLSFDGDISHFKNRMDTLMQKRFDIDEKIYLRKDESTFPVELHGRIIELESRELVLAVVRDITERKKSEEDLKMRSQLLDSATDSIIVHDMEGNLTYVNDAACRLFGYERAELMNINFHLLHVSSPTVFESKEQEILKKIADEGTITFETTDIRKDGSLVPVEVHDKVIESGGKKLVIGVIRDITERKKVEEYVKQLAYHDPLTGLPNRSLLADRFNLAQANAKRSQHLLALLVMDLDNFKYVNDTLGHSAGDKLLKEVGSRLVNIVRKTDTVTRLGGDEFVLLLAGIKREEDAASIARKILEEIRNPYLLLDHELRITASIGIAFYPVDGDDLDTAVKHADSAMYRMKDQGRNGLLCYTREMDIADDIQYDRAGSEIEEPK